MSFTLRGIGPRQRWDRCAATSRKVAGFSPFFSASRGTTSSFEPVQLQACGQRLQLAPRRLQVERGAPDRGEYRKTAGAGEQGLVGVGELTRQVNRILKLISAGLTAPDVPNTTI
jgi:hypothetical protein